MLACVFAAIEEPASLLWSIDAIAGEPPSPAALLSRCIKTDWPVAKVDYTTEGLVTVTSRDGRIERGTHVVSALPLSVLQDGVSFSS